jgi:sorbitol-specific phosphotransferase system component IIBC
VLAKGGRKALLAAVLAPVVDAEVARGLIAALLAVPALHLVLAQAVLAAPVLPPVVLALVLHLHPPRLALPGFVRVLEAPLVLLLQQAHLP